MDANSLPATTLLGMLAEVNERLSFFAAQLRHRTGIKSATLYRFAPTFCTSTSISGASNQLLGSDFGVSVDLSDGAVIDFWLDFWFDGDCWAVESAIHKHNADEDGSHRVALLANESFKGIDEALTYLSSAVAQLTTSIDLSGNPFPYVT